MAAPDLGLHGQGWSRLFRSADRLGRQRLCDRVDRRHLLFEPVRRPHVRGGAVHGREPSRRRAGDPRHVLGKGFSDVLRADARPCAALRAHDLGLKLDRVHPYEKRAEGIRHRADGRDDRLDSRGLAALFRAPGQGRGRGSGGEPQHLPTGRRHLAPARGLQPDAAAHAAKTCDGGRRRLRLAHGRTAALEALPARAVCRHVHRFGHPQRLLPAGRQLSWQRDGRDQARMDHAGDEHRPGGRDPHDGRPRIGARSARLEDDDDPRHSRARGPVRRLRLHAAEPADDHRGAGAARHLLCVLLRHALHLHRRCVSEGRPVERPEPVQPARTRTR